MKRTLTALTAAIFASALALPAFAQMGAGDGSTTTGSMSASTTESTQTENRAVAQPAPVTNSVEKHEYRSERTDEVAGSVAPPEAVHSRVENKVTTSTTNAVVPPPVVEQSTTTTRHTESERNTNTGASNTGY
jgi:hypothetical protein